MARYSLRKIRLNAGGYELGTISRYYGHGQPIFRAYNDDTGNPEDTLETRAKDRDAAKAWVRTHDPDATFYR